ncbi:putative protein YpbG [Eubacterium plexicaudatum ASF492]|uniref:Calcineurin-like phosphoesterase domain-containing protein n=1 Tax=Eubacterium plexicaudatum ASF492 TaxID=1235802 RepID=N2BHJ2_9FIRM|nr:putative protein YpbG [Eubacterium plexicaudatum ASF492]
MNVLIGIISVIVVIYLFWQYQELKKFEITHYEMPSNKVLEQLNIVVISDLHSFSYGSENRLLLKAVKDAAPDLILIPGDLIVTGKTEKYDVSLRFLQELCALDVPVLFSSGNHESKAALPQSESFPVYRQYCGQMERTGVITLNNKSHEVTVRSTKVRVSGLELPLTSYKKGRKPYLEEDYLISRLGAPSDEHLQILLAHHPAFARQYARWGADLTVCGHNHGGLVCIPGIGSVISPQFVPFPKYDAGEFTVDGRKIYISRGLGTHTFHVRVFNRAELVVITVKPE